MSASQGHRQAAQVFTRPESPRPEPEARRVLVVNAALARRVEEAGARATQQLRVTAAPSFLAAMGELTRQPAEVVIGQVDALTGMLDSAARCLRHLAPQARLILVAGHGQRTLADRALRSGFDAVVTEPADAATLARAIGLRVQVEAAPEPEPAPEAPHDEPQAVAPPDSDELGDVDLVEAILSSREPVAAMAMRIVQARSGIRQVGWASRRDDVPPGHACEAVSYRGHTFGYLHAPAPARREHLLGWAGWLSRWLALDEQVHQLEDLSMKDELTGAWNRRYFNRFLEHILDQAARDRSQVTLMVFDIDDFKVYNDRYGHAAGDEILREATRLMQSFVREHDVVARIGGDEFAVIFWDAGAKRRPDSHHPDSVRQAAKRFQKAICAHRFPKLLDEAPGTLTISGGLASFPWDGRTPEELLERADAMALQSKRQGKNAITFGRGALGQCGEEGEAVPES